MSADDDDKRRIKLVIVGDGAVGKTCLLATFSTGTFPEEYVPTVFDNQIVEQDYNGESILVQVWDTAGQEDYDRLRPLSYPGSDIVLLCYSTVSQASYEAVEEKWIEEVKEYIEDVPVLLIGTKTDMRDENIADIVEETFTPVSTEEGKTLAEDIDAQFIESSAKTKYNVAELFQQAIKLGLEKKYGSSSPVLPKEKKKESKPEEVKEEEEKEEKEEEEEETVAAVEEEKKEKDPKKEKEKEKEKDDKKRKPSKGSKKDKKDEDKKEKPKKKRWWNR